MEYFIKVENLTKKYSDKIALDNFSINIPKGCIYGVLGPNGAGKTTFIRILNQITKADSGRILFDGEELNINCIKKIGYMPEERGLYKNMRIGEQLIYLSMLKGLNKKEAKERLEYWFNKLNINKWWNKKLSELSKGMAQKIQFVVTVIHDPELLIFDEPFSGFDPINANMIRDQIIEQKEKGTTIIFSTHRMESVDEICDYVSLINKSKKVLDGLVKDIKNEYKQNIFNITMKNISSKNLEKLIQEKDISNLIQTDNQYNFSIKNLDLENSNSLILELSKIGTIISFYEEIPNMNEIFINAIK